MRELSRMSRSLSSGTHSRDPLAHPGYDPRKASQDVDALAQSANSSQNFACFALPRFRRKTFCAKPICLMFAARLAARVNVRPMRKTQLGHKCFAAFEFSGAPRTAHRQRTPPNLG
jgi:hypothetical protein